MGAPQGFGERVAAARRDDVLALRDRAMRQRAVALDAARAFAPGREMEMLEGEIERQPHARYDRRQQQRMQRPGQKARQAEQSAAANSPAIPLAGHRPGQTRSHASVARAPRT